MEQRFDDVDIAKGIGIMLVIMGHIEYNYVPFCGSVHIPLFFILAGYLYDIDKTQNRTYGELTGRRVKRLLIPYFIYNMILYVKYLLKLILSHTFTMRLGVQGLLGFVYSSALFYKNVPAEENFEGFIFGNAPLWFLTAMAVSSVIFYFITVTAFCEAPSFPSGSPVPASSPCHRPRGFASSPQNNADGSAVAP